MNFKRNFGRYQNRSFYFEDKKYGMLTLWPNYVNGKNDNFVQSILNKNVVILEHFGVVKPPT